LFASAVAACKLRAKVLDDREKKAKADEVQELRARVASQTQRALQRVLDGLRREFFRGVDETDGPRATLFVCREPEAEAGLRKRLVIYDRAGAYKNSSCTWVVDDDERDRCRGLAGQAWFAWRTAKRTAACDWPTDGNPAEKEQYARSLDLTLAEAETLNVKSRTLIAAPIDVKGERWGVLVLDCRKVVTMSDSPSSTQNLLLRLSVAAIGGILAEAD
jgi:hypothetical protein